VANTLTFRLELVRRVEIVIHLRGTISAIPLITGCGRRLQVNTDLGLTAFVRVVGFPCALGKNFTLVLHFDNWPAAPNAQFQYGPHDRHTIYALRAGG
jgi:hypothetical protein